MGQDAGQIAATYDERMRQMIVGVVRAVRRRRRERRRRALHGERRASLGGGERSAQTYMDYAVGAAAFPAHAHYVALGHLHRTQQIAGAAPIWYSGSPLQVDFGEVEGPSSVLLVTADRKSPAVVRPVAVAGGRRLRTLRGTVDQLRALARHDRRRLPAGRRRRSDQGRPRGGRARAPRRLGRRGAARRARRTRPGGPPESHRRPDAARALRRVPREQGIADDRLTALFAELLDEGAS